MPITTSMTSYPGTVAESTMDTIIDTDATPVTVIANENVPVTVCEKRHDTNGVTTDAPHPQVTTYAILLIYKPRFCRLQLNNYH